MNIFQKLFYFFFFAAVLFFFIWALYLPKEDVTEKINQLISQQQEKQDVYFQGVTFQEVAGGKKYWEIKARTSSIDQDTQIATLETALGTFYEKNQPTLNFITPRAIWNMEKKEITLFDPVGFDVSMASEIKDLLSMEKSPFFLKLPENYQGRGRGYFFRAKSLSWKMSDQRIICPHGIWLFKGNVSGYGERLTADVAMENVILSGHPRITVKNSPSAIIEAREFTANNPQNTISAKAGVNLTSGAIRVYADEAKYFQSRGIIELYHNIKMKYNDMRAQGQFATYDIVQGTITLSGSARLIRGNSVVEGEKVVASLKDKKFKVEGKTRIVIPEKEIEP